MNILMVTNTYSPHVGGVARSVEQFVTQYRSRGHRVIVLAPQFEGQLARELDVIRIPAIQNFNGSDFSVRLPIPTWLYSELNEFEPDVVHSHHPFLLGDTALRIANSRQVPIVFSHHTMYEQYTHYVPGDSQQLKDFVITLSTGYANLCNRVIAPSQSIKDIIQDRGVDTEIDVIPTGVDIKRFENTEPGALRSKLSIPKESLVVGHVGRLAPEKNLLFLSKALEQLANNHKNVTILLAGEGPSKKIIEERFHAKHLDKQLLSLGQLEGQGLVDCYNAMDVFAFSSLSETQGMVLLEAMATGCPVVALDAPGARDVVIDGQNGRLLKTEKTDVFVSALEEILFERKSYQDKLSEQARSTALANSIEQTALDCLRMYENLVDARLQTSDLENSTWALTLRAIETEWSLLSTTVRAIEGVVSKSTLGRFFSMRSVINLLQSSRKWFNRSEWSIRLLSLWKSTDHHSSPGVILLQIDGLSRPDLEAAIALGKAPLMRRLIRREGYELFDVYSGIPATTASAQGELFYGKRQIVPAFAFYDSNRKKYVRMFEPSEAAEVEKTLQAHSEGLLAGGSSYSNIYSGGAQESNFCSATIGWHSLFNAANPWAILGVLLWHGWNALRCMVLMVWELLLALAECVHGTLLGERFWHELRFIPSRLGICVLLREMVTAGAAIDAYRGLPIIHVNFLGYDEQAHRRGPQSQFAHRAVKGIDSALGRIWRAGCKSPRRDYVIWIYSDHGQETTSSYPVVYNKTVATAIREIVSNHSQQSPTIGRYQSSAELLRARWLGGGNTARRFVSLPNLANHSYKESDPIVVAEGPLGFVYFKDSLPECEKEELASRITKEAMVPIVIYRKGGELFAATWGGIYNLAHDAAFVFGEKHPFLQEVTRDIDRLSQHPHSGEFILLGWKKDGSPISFPVENGGHGGVGYRETHSFALLPKATVLPAVSERHLSFNSLRLAALHHLGRKSLVHAQKRNISDRKFRVMTYNVHGCVGLDGKLTHQRIARLISQFEPDIIALQELDVGRSRSYHLDQAQEIADSLRMYFHFHPALQIEGELYGNAIISRYPLALMKAKGLPSSSAATGTEPRGAIWVKASTCAGEIHCFNTHLGLTKTDRESQSNALLGPDWLENEKLSGPTIFCGDLNATPRSSVYKRFRRRLRDVHEDNGSKQHHATWVGLFPFLRLDHIFVSDHIEVKNSFVVKNALSKRSSDHLPLIADLELKL